MFILVMFFAACGWNVEIVDPTEPSESEAEISSETSKTEDEISPETSETAFSTLAEQAAQLIPVTLYCSIFIKTPSSGEFSKRFSAKCRLYPIIFIY